MTDDEIEVPLSRDEQARLAREVRVGGLSFVEIRRRLAVPVESHIVGLGLQERYRHPAARERVWSALWRFFANEIKPSASEGLFAAAAEYLNAERMSLLLGHAVQEAALVTADGGGEEAISGRGELSSLPDRELLDGMKAGLRAFETIMEAFHPALLNHILARVHLPDIDESDISQLVWLAAWRKLAFEDSYQPDLGGIYCFLRVFFLRRAVTDALRQLGRKQQLMGLLSREWGLPTPDEPKAEPTPLVVETSEDPETTRLRSAAQERLMCLLFRHGGYPHEILTVALGKGIYGRRTPRGIEADLGRVEAGHGAQRLLEAARDFSKAFKTMTAFSPLVFARINECMDNLRDQLALPFLKLAEGATPKDTKTIDLAPKDLLDRLAGESALAAFAWKPDKSVGEQMFRWCENVGRRLRARLGCKNDSSARSPGSDRTFDEAAAVA